MKKVELNKYDLIVNTILKYDLEEERRIVTDKELERYGNVMRSWASRVNIDLSWDSDNSDNFKDIDKYIYEINKDGKNYYGIWPWIRTGQLYDFKMHIPLDLLVLMHDTSEIQLLKDNEVYKEELDIVENSVIKKALNSSNEDIKRITNNYYKVLYRR